MLAALALTCILSSCTMVTQNRAWPGVAWAWSEEARLERRVRAEREAASKASDLRQEAHLREFHKINPQYAGKR